MLGVTSQLPRELVRLLTHTSATRHSLFTPFFIRSFSSSSSPSHSHSHSHFSFKTGVAYHGKPEFEPSPTDKPRPKKVLQGFAPDSEVARWRDEKMKSLGMEWGGGHDWFFEKRFQADCGEGVVVGITDGVGGWEESGVDPAVFSQALCYYAEKTVEEEAETDPRTLMRKAFDKVQDEDRVIAGSSTACFMTFFPDGLVRAANLGDSTFLLVRSTEILHMQPPQTHFFNAPRQLAKMPKGRKQGKNFSDYPEMSDLWEADLQDGDLIVMVTDGFSDNVWPRELSQIVQLIEQKQKEHNWDEQTFLNSLAMASLNYARMCSFKMDKESPFEAEARGFGHHDLRGGKVDDVTVLVVRCSSLSKK